MKRSSKDRDLRQAADSKKMQAAIDWAEEHSLEIFRTTDHCVQIDGVNFWPDTGTIQQADRKKHTKKGLPALAEFLDRPPPSRQPTIVLGVYDFKG
jgi:hypothetical protein